jgi:ADP-ribosylglycohydrolase
MLPSLASLRSWLRACLDDLDEQGRDVEALRGELDALADSYDAFVAFGTRLDAAPMRADWAYVEPDELASILAECDPARPREPLTGISDLGARAEAAFLARVCGCMLGKPFEIDPTMAELREALEPVGEWPLDDYLTEAGLERLPERQGQWPELVRERITHVAPDDDINYTILAMLLLEQHGEAFTHDDMRALWLLNLPVRATFGPERTALVDAALRFLVDGDVARLGNPGAELCGALIRADAYGYACMGDPARAAELAYRDASFTHGGTGAYATMFIAAAIAAAPFGDDRLDMFRTALGFVPQRSRFAERARIALAEVEAASDFEDAYERIHVTFGSYSHCRVYQEIGTLMNTLRFARDTGHGICLQVMQGNDTDSFGATAGSLLGARFGPKGLDPRWLAPFNDDLHTALAMFHERSLTAVATRMATLTKLQRRDT